jgi:hypothetical protein
MANWEKPARTLQPPGPEETARDRLLVRAADRVARYGSGVTFDDGTSSANPWCHVLDQLRAGELAHCGAWMLDPQDRPGGRLNTRPSVTVAVDGTVERCKHRLK